MIRPWMIWSWIALGSSGCALPDENKDRCDVVADCLSGYLCVSNVCQRAGGDDPQTQELTTWTDPAAGLLWQTPVRLNVLSWSQAQAFCEALVLGDQTDWRLPNITELRTLVRGCDLTQPAGPCQVSESCTSAFADCGWESCQAGCAPGDTQPAVGGCFWDPALNQGPLPSLMMQRNFCHWSTTQDPISQTRLALCFYQATIVQVTAVDAEVPAKGYSARCVRKLP